MEINKNKLSQLISLIKCPSVTEKSTNLYKDNQYTFLVDPSLTKPEIKEVIENLFDVKISGISTCMVPQKKRRVGKYVGKRSSYKKAFIKLKNGEKITELFN
jgi:large subunit ribosomal protein L23